MMRSQPFDSLRTLASSKIGMVKIPEPLEVAMKRIGNNIPHSDLRTAVNRINDSLTSSGSKKLISIAKQKSTVCLTNSSNQSKIKAVLRISPNPII